MEKPSDDWTDQETEILVDEIILRQVSCVLNSYII